MKKHHVAFDILMPHLADEARLVLVCYTVPPRDRFLVGRSLLHVQAVEVGAAKLQKDRDVSTSTYTI